MEISNKKIALDVLIFSFLSFAAAKTIKLFYITLHNHLEQDQWSYWLAFRNWDIEKTWPMLVSPILLAPIFETLIFCVVLYRICAKLKLHGYGFVLLSAVIFALFHFIREGAGIYTLVYSFTGGSIFALFYVRQLKHSGNESKTFVLTSLVHAICNLMLAFI